MSEKEVLKSINMYVETALVCRFTISPGMS